MQVIKGFWNDLAELKLTDDQVARIREIVAGDVDMTDPGKFPKTADWVRQCYNCPSLHELTMSALDEVVETYGVESITTSGGVLEYLNAGDTYAVTLLFWRGLLRVGCYGDIVEKYDTVAEY